MHVQCIRYRQPMYTLVCMYIGYGNIGKQLLQRLKVFQPENIYIIQRSTGPKHLKSEDSQHSQTCIHIGTNDNYIEYAKYTDICFICCSQNSDNLGMVNREFIYSLRKGAVIVNVARVCICLCIGV